ncbi:uncharacterized protein G2W53_001033 [Senna tora]|uniref:Uncharacterized protein n=1 Tax=Senna tora TaxID=362788 RepID=A0A834XGG1_9FABA|nr:uncharacterized protein G2W53_001033 [Senna tora]
MAVYIIALFTVANSGSEQHKILRCLLQRGWWRVTQKRLVARSGKCLLYVVPLVVAMEVVSGPGTLVYSARRTQAVSCQISFQASSVLAYVISYWIGFSSLNVGIISPCSGYLVALPNSPGANSTQFKVVEFLSSGFLCSVSLIPAGGPSTDVDGGQKCSTALCHSGSRLLGSPGFIISSTIGIVVAAPSLYSYPDSEKMYVVGEGWGPINIPNFPINELIVSAMSGVRCSIGMSQSWIHTVTLVTNSLLRTKLVSHLNMVRRPPCIAHGPSFSVCCLSSSTSK